MEMYLHDSGGTFRIVLKGELTDEGAKQLWWAWETAKSILNGRPLTVEVSGISKAQASGIGILCRMRESGGRIVAAHPPKCADLTRFLDVPAVTSTQRVPRWTFWSIRVPHRASSGVLADKSNGEEG